MITEYHAKYYAHELTRQSAGDDIDRISTSLFDASNSSGRTKLTN